MLESGAVKFSEAIGRKEGVDSSYVRRMVNLTTLAPDIVEAIFGETFAVGTPGVAKMAFNCGI